MAILDLTGAKRLEGYKPSRGRRTLDAGSIPGLANSGTGLGGFAAAKINRLTMDFIARSRSADQDLFGDNIRLRSRARKLALDNPHARKFLAMVKQNVVGHNGIRMKSKVTGLNGKDTAATDKINQRIEEEWLRWCRKGRCTADGKFSYIELQQLAIVNIAREGENIVKNVFGRQFNETGYALQPIDNDQLDDTYVTSLENGGSIRMGVEQDRYRRPTAYHLWNGNPNDIFQDSRLRTRVPADQIIHSAIWERPGQSRGYTWLSAAILPLNMYGGFEEATLVASRASAAKFVTIQTPYADGMDFEDEDEQGGDQNIDGTKLMTANPGEALVLDPGQEANYIDPRFPMSTYKEFSQAALRSVASGLLVSYPSLANDLEGVNFSSIRAGLLEERDCWRLIQKWFIDHFCEEIRMKWLETALLTTLADITLSRDQMEQVAWMPRGWTWVDPQKDANAIILKLGEGMTTMEKECAEIGMDWMEVAKQRKKEQDYFNKLGVQFGVDITGDQGGKGVAADAEADVAKEGADGKAAQDGDAGQQQDDGKGTGKTAKS